MECAMKVLKVALAAAAVALFSSQAHADSVFFKAPMNFAGTGCPAGSMSVTGENTDTLTVMFDKYDAAKPNSKAASKMERTGCSFSVPVHVPQGFQVSNMTADWRGYAEGSTELFREYFFAGQTGPKVRSNPKSNYTLTDNLQHATWSPCNAREVPMRINSSVRAAGNPSYISVDSIDLHNKVKLVFHLSSRACR